MNDALRDKGAAQRQTAFYADFERLIELIGSNDLGIDKKFAQAICGAARIRMMYAS